MVTLFHQTSARILTVRIVENSTEKEIPVTRVEVGTLVVVGPGEKILVDGMVAQGSSYVDESMISGEPLAVEEKKGANAVAGTVNQKVSFRFLAEKAGGETLLAQIIRMPSLCME